MRSRESRVESRESGVESRASASAAHAEWNWTIGEVVAPFGRIGEVKLRITTDFPERFAALKQVCLRARHSARLYTVERARLHKGQALLKLEGIESIDDAELLRGALAQVRREEAVPLPEDSYYVVDLVGLDVVTQAGRVVGKVDDVLAYPAHDLLKIGDVLIPVVKEFIVQVDVAGGRIVIAPPDGLLPDEKPDAPH